jgi:Acetyltransferase (GNAT) domain
MTMHQEQQVLENRSLCRWQEWLGCAQTPRYDQTQDCAGWQFYYTQEIDKLDTYWAPQNDRLQRVDYLKALENAPSSNLSPRYLLVSREGKVVGGLVLQVVLLDTAKQIRELRELQGGNLWQRLRRWAAGCGCFRMLVWGNTLLTGEHSEWWNLPENEIPAARHEVLRYLPRLAKTEGASVFLAKDHYAKDEALNHAGYHPIDFQPAMYFQLDPSWKNMQDYLDAMTSKYRVRARKAFQKAEGLVFRELDLRQIGLFQDDIYRLYMQIINAADFNLSAVAPSYFYQMKSQLGEDFQLCACFKQDQLLGFFTTFKNGDELEANFIGFEKEANREHQLYLNMLYRMVEKGIQERVKMIDFARTAMEIKSSVGAVAQQAYIYMRHRNKWLNQVLPMAVRFVEPKVEWVARNPFREE